MAWASGLSEYVCACVVVCRCGMHELSTTKGLKRQVCASGTVYFDGQDLRTSVQRDQSQESAEGTVWTESYTRNIYVSCSVRGCGLSLPCLTTYWVALSTTDHIPIPSLLSPLQGSIPLRPHVPKPPAW